MLNKIKTFFKKDPTVKFYATLPGVDKLMPIILAKEFKPKWLTAARDDFKKNLGGEYPTRPINSPHKCPGIVDLLNTGWIVRAWQDITIETNGDGENFQWRSSVSGQEFRAVKDVGYLPGSMLLDYLPKKDDTLRTIIKFQAPWLVDVPKGYSLLFIPMLYSDDGRFTNAPGVLDTSIDKQLNIQVFWHSLNSTEVIRAGTPLAHLILLPTNLVINTDIIPYSEKVRESQFVEMYKNALRYLGNYNN